MKSLYGNVGRKLKIMACVIFVILALGSVVFGFANMVTDDILNMGDEVGIIVGLLCIVLGPIFSFCSSLALYGFGELIEKACEIAENTSRSSKKESSSSVSKPKANKNIKINEPTYTAKNPTPKNDFYELIKKLPEIKNDKDFVKAYANDSDFQKELSMIDEEFVQLQFIDLAYEFYDTEMTEQELQERKIKLLEEYGYSLK